LGADLSYGFERRVERDEEQEEHLDGLLESLRNWMEEGGELKKGALITWRGMMTRWVGFARD
jgi:RAT1-interacting protein